MNLDSPATWHTKTLADYACTLALDVCPEDVVERAKLLVIDNLGCILAGTRSPITASMIRTFSPMFGAAQATIVGTPYRASIVEAAQINATSSNALDFDDTVPGAHPGGAIIPGALALAENRKLSGREFLDAVVTGYEIALRVGASIQPTAERAKVVWCTGTWHTMGAVAAAAKLMKLSNEKVLNAYGIAGATAPLPSHQKWGWPMHERPIHWVKEGLGWAASQGTLAALLAEQDFVGNRYILDGDTGFWRMTGSDQVDYERMVRNLGSEFELRRMGFKPYPCCRYQHPALAALSELMEEEGFTGTDVQSVEICSFDWVKIQETYDPANVVDSQFAMPHNAAMVLLGVPAARWAAPETIADQAVRSYSRRITVSVDPQIDGDYDRHRTFAARVHVQLSNGKRITKSISVLPGSPANPMSPDDIKAKFRMLAATVLDDPTAARLLELLEHVEDVPDMQAVAKLCSVHQS